VRIAMVTSRYPYGGADRVAWMLARELASRHDVTFITTGEYDESVREEGHRRVVIGLPRHQRFWHHYVNPTVVRKLKRHLAEIRPDVVHFHSVANRTFSAASLLVSRVYPTVWSLHDVWSQCIWHNPRPAECRQMLGGCVACRSMPGLSVVNRFLKERVWRHVALHLVLCSEWMKGFLRRSALGRVPMDVIPNGVDLRRFDNLDRTGARKGLGIPKDARVALFVGDMKNPVKGCRELLGIAERITRDEEDVWFVLVGDHAASSPACERIVLTGAVPAEEIPGMFAAADVFVLPSRAEHAPLVILEAMAAGVPQVAYAVGGIPEQIVDGQTGLMAAPRDARGLESALRELLGDARRRKAMGRAARKRVEKHFSLDEQVARTESLYERVKTAREVAAGLPSEAPQPLVSIVMPAYNSARHIGRAIESVLRQTYETWELIIVDDGSTDDTSDVVKGFADDRIEYVRTKNGGASAARNAGLDKARGEVVAFLDSDDVWYADKLAVQMATFRKSPEVVLTYCNYDRIDGSGRRLESHRFSLAKLPQGRRLDPLLVRSALGPATAIAIRRDTLDACGRFDVELPVSEDWDLWWRVALRGELRYVSRALAAYRVHAGTLSERYDLLQRCDRIVIGRMFSDAELGRRFPAGKLQRLRNRAEAIRLYNAGSGHLRAGNPKHAAASFLESMRTSMHDIRQVVMLAVSVIFMLPLVNRKRLLSAVSK